MTTTITFAPFARSRAPRHWVYLKEKWSDAWTAMPHLWCDFWSRVAAPNISTAEFYWRHGRGLRPGENLHGWVERLTGKERWFVKVVSESFPLTGESQGTKTVGVLPDQANLLRWDGQIDFSTDVIDGRITDTDQALRYFGQQTFTAYGLEQILARTIVRRSKWKKSDGTEPWIERALTFNRPDTTGRLAGSRSSAVGAEGTYLFGPAIGQEDSVWSTRNIVQYLCWHHSPESTNAATPAIRFQLQPGNERLPTWDSPVLPTEERSVLDLLHQLMPRGRLLTFIVSVTPNDAGTNETVNIVPRSLIGAPIVLPSGNQIAESVRQYSLIQQQDRDSQAAAQSNSLLCCDQVRFRGARRTTTCTISAEDTSLVAGWNPAQETLYEAAGSGAGDYAAQTTEEKQRRNELARSAPDLETVYRRFALPDGWDGLVSDGRLGTFFSPAFPRDDNPALPYPVYVRELHILPWLAIKQGYDYTNPNGSTYFTPLRVTKGPHNPAQALVYFRFPDQPTKYIPVERIGQLAKVEQTQATQNHHFSCRVEIPQEDRAILLEVNGQPQHVIAYADFTKLAADPVCGQWNWRNAVFTVTLEDDRYCEGIWPPEANLPALIGLGKEIRRLVVQGGDEFRQDYLAPHTVVGLNQNTGALLECAAGGLFNNDKQKLEDRARLAYEYYKLPRMAITFQCHRPIAELLPGDLLNEVDGVAGTSVNAIISEIRVEFPKRKGPVVYRLVSGHAEADFLIEVLK